MNAEPGFTIVNGQRLETLWLPPAAGNRAPSIVMLHEGLGSVSMWKDFPQKLAARTGTGVLVYSRYGYGQSDRLEGKRAVEYMHHEAETVLPAMLDEFHIEKPILFGHSDGGSIALLFAGAFPERPAGIVVEAPHVFVEDITVTSIAGAKTIYETTDLPKKLGRYHADVDRTFWGWNDIWLDPRFRAWNIESYLPKIRCPALLLQGLDDEYGTPAQLEAIQARVPWAELTLLPTCGHSPHRDQLDAVLDSTARFVEKVT